MAYFAANEMLERHTGESYYASLSVESNDEESDEARVEAQTDVIEAVMRRQWMRDHYPEAYADEGEADAEAVGEDAVAADENAAGSEAAAGGEAPDVEVGEAGVPAAANGGAGDPTDEAGEGHDAPEDAAQGDAEPAVAAEPATVDAGSGTEAAEGASADLPEAEAVDGEYTGAEAVTQSDGPEAASAVEAAPVEGSPDATAAPELAALRPEWAQAQQGEEEADIPPFDEEAYRAMLEELEIRPSSMDFAPIQESCPDLVGWLRIDDTVIDYPVVKGPDDEYYLHHLADQKPNSNGAIMMEAENDPLWRDMITTLHGHHMRSGAMFGDLADYGKEGYYEAHPVLWIYTPLGDFQGQIFAACVVDPMEFGYPMFLPEEEFDAMIEQVRRDTPFDAPVEVAYGDRLVILSTCEYTFPNARYIVLAKLVPWPEEEPSEAGEGEPAAAQE